MVIVKRGNTLKLCPEKLIAARKSLNITKAEAARRLNISAMAYGRYERGEREPSYQSVCYIAQIFNCNVDYLYGNSDQKDCDYILVSKETPELYTLIEFTKEHKGIETQLLEYAKKIANGDQNKPDTQDINYLQKSTPSP